MKLDLLEEVFGSAEATYDEDVLSGVSTFLETYIGSYSPVMLCSALEWQ